MLYRCSFIKRKLHSRICLLLYLPSEYTARIYCQCMYLETQNFSSSADHDSLHVTSISHILFVCTYIFPLSNLPFTYAWYAQT